MTQVSVAHGIEDVPYQTWKQRNGELIRIIDMDDKHLFNTIRVCERNAEIRRKRADKFQSFDPADWFDNEPEHFLPSAYKALVAVAKAVIVLFINNSALALEDIERDTEGNIRKAWVTNGGWTLVINNGEMQAKSRSAIVTRQPIKTLEEVEVKDSGDYNSNISKAREQRAAQ